MCFLGFVHRYECVESTARLTLALMLNHKLVASYIEYLTAVRKSSPGTIGEALTAAISACRWLYRKERAASEPLVTRRYKDWRNEYQSKAARVRAQDDADELQERGKWIGWSEFTDTVQRLRHAWKASLEDDDGARVTVQSSRQLHDVLLLGLYACIPGRGAEVRLLQYWSDEDLQQHRKGGLTMKKCVERHEANIVARSEGGGVWKMWVSQFKNARFHGVDCTELTTDNFGWWIDLLEQYLEQGYRAKLLKPNATHKYLFVTRSGEPFSQSYFSDFISSLLLKHTGKRVATNVLRSSFVTAFYASDASKDPRLQVSVASVMRHSVKQAQATYDRRSASSRKRQGLELLGDLATAGTRGGDPKKIARVDGGEPVVVQWRYRPFQVVRTDASQHLLAPMQRLATSNAPVYSVPLNAVYEWKAAEECSPIQGQWQEAEFLMQ